MLKLWIDDDARKSGMMAFRYPPDDTWTIATSSKEAIEIVQREGFPVELGTCHHSKQTYIGAYVGLFLFKLV